MKEKNWNKIKRIYDKKWLYHVCKKKKYLHKKYKDFQFSIIK